MSSWMKSFNKSNDPPKPALEQFWGHLTKGKIKYDKQPASIGVIIIPAPRCWVGDPSMHV
jgi:hypothetical protein